MSSMSVLAERQSWLTPKYLVFIFGVGLLMFRFVRFVSTPEVLERVGTVEAELVQLDGAIREHAFESTKVWRSCDNTLFYLETLEPFTAAQCSSKEVTRASPRSCTHNVIG